MSVNTRGDSSAEYRQGLKATAFWDRWNAEHREHALTEVSRRQQAVVTKWLEDTGRTDLRILDVGCGTGWLEKTLTQFGEVMATDLSSEVLKRAAVRNPTVMYMSGDFLTMDFSDERFDVVVSLEVLAHVPDQADFVERLHGLLVDGGMLLLATQNPTVLRRTRVDPVAEGQHRHWLSRREVRDLLEAHGLRVDQAFTVTPEGMRVINSDLLNRVAGLLRARAAFDRIKEKLGLGWTIMVRAHRNAGSK